MTVEEISSRINNVDSGLDQRRMLVNILKEKLGMPAATSPPAPQLPETAPAEAEVVLEVDGKDPNPGGSGIDTVIAEVDRTYGERKKIIDALRVQISVSAAQPKSASMVPPRPYVQATPRALGPPAEKRAKTSVAVAAPRVVPLAPAPLLPTTAMAAQVPLAAPLLASAPLGLSAAQQAEQALLEARKSKMLQNLRVAEQLGAGPAMSASSDARTAIPQMLPTVPLAPTSGAGLVPGGSAMPPSSNGMSFPPAPVGATPEEYEAYRQDCWRQYNQYVNVWHKYYNKNKAEKEAAASGAQKKASAPRPQAQWPSGSQSGGPGWPTPAAAGMALGGQSTAGAPPDQRSMDEIIHSDLLGL